MGRAAWLLSLLPLLVFLGCAGNAGPGVSVAPPPADTKALDNTLRAVLDHTGGVSPNLPAWGEVEASLLEAVNGMKLRHPELAAWKARACLGENNRGYVALQVSPELSEPDKENQVQKLLAGENKDRKILYRELARLTKFSVSVVEQAAAGEWLRRAQPGEAVQMPSTEAALNPFRATEMGRKLGDACRLEAWIILP